jgi:hypothetical protein
MCYLFLKHAGGGIRLGHSDGFQCICSTGGRLTRCHRNSGAGSNCFGDLGDIRWA